jgi:hypothetical protein
MTENDLVQATASWINLTYTTAEWWVTVTTAMVVAVYFAAKHIAPWFFGLVVLLYALSTISVMFEFSEYGALAFSYGVQLTEMRIARRAIGADVEPSFVLRMINSYAVYVTIALGAFGAIAFSFVHWRKVQAAA